MKRENSNSLNAEQTARLARLSALPDEAIDTADIPEVRDWTGARRGLFYFGASAGDKITVALDAEVVDWFEGNGAPGEDFESRINRVLSEHVAERTRKAS
jgi:uncharacterized protein (DUF4415 family)